MKLYRWKCVISLLFYFPRFVIQLYTNLSSLLFPDPNLNLIYCLGLPLRTSPRYLLSSQRHKTSKLGVHFESWVFDPYCPRRLYLCEIHTSRAARVDLLYARPGLSLYNMGSRRSMALEICILKKNHLHHLLGLLPWYLPLPGSSPSSSLLRLQK